MQSQVVALADAHTGTDQLLLLPIAHVEHPSDEGGMKARKELLSLRIQGFMR